MFSIARPITVSSFTPGCRGGITGFAFWRKPFWELTGVERRSPSGWPRVGAVLVLDCRGRQSGSRLGRRHPLPCRPQDAAPILRLERQREAGTRTVAPLPGYSRLSGGQGDLRFHAQPRWRRTVRAFRKMPARISIRFPSCPASWVSALYEDRLGG